MLNRKTNAVSTAFANGSTRHARHNTTPVPPIDGSFSRHSQKIGNNFVIKIHYIYALPVQEARKYFPFSIPYWNSIEFFPYS